MASVSLRPLVRGDAPELFSLIDHNRAPLAKFWWTAGTQTIADSRNFITNAIVDEGMHSSVTRAICADEKVIGVGALHTIDWERKHSLLGYWIDQSENGKGYGTGVVRQLARIAFEEYNLSEIEIATREANVASRTVADRAGFSLTAIDEQPMWETHPDAPIPTAHYILKAADYIQAAK